MPVQDIVLKNTNPEVKPSPILPYYMSRDDRIDGTRPANIAQPLLRFSDLVSGPNTGLGDGKGQGVIVTVWAQGLTEAQGTIVFTDANGIEHSPAYVYYWKKADGKLPGGPADLWRSHAMYEVAFSIPSAAAAGLGSIKLRSAVTTGLGGGWSRNTLPFTIRTGRILWISPTGNNANPGTFALPKKYINGGDSGLRDGLGNSLQEGDTVYNYGVTEKPLSELGISDTYPQYACFIRKPSTCSIERQVMLVQYPGKVAMIQGLQKGFSTYGAEGVGCAKYKIEVGHIATSTTTITSNVYANSHIGTCRYGRFVGNELTDKAGMCSTGQAGSIVGTGYSIDKVEVLGNWLHDIGCDGTSHYQHTTYFSCRDSTVTDATAIKFKFNFLENCKAKYGFHAYDQIDGSGGSTPGNVIGTWEVCNNVFYKQKGAAISIHTIQNNYANEVWTTDAIICNNIIVEAGKGPVSSAETSNSTSPVGILLGTKWKPSSLKVEGNLVWRYSDPSSRTFVDANNLTVINPPYALVYSFLWQPTTFSIKGNLFVNDGNYDFINATAGNVATPTASYNASYSLSALNTKVLPGSWTNTVEGQNIKTSVYKTLPDVQKTSPLKIGAALTYHDTYDFYGRVRAGTIGPVEVIPDVEV